MSEITASSSASDGLLSKGIVLMEDSEPERKLITREIRRWFTNETVPIRYARGEDDVISFHKEGCQIYIVDIHMGEDRQQEGLNVLERLKKSKSFNFVAILSGKIEPFMRETILKKADVVQQKTGNRTKDIEIIESTLHQRCEEMLKSIRNVLHNETEKIEEVIANSSNLDFISISSELERMRAFLSVKVLSEILESNTEQTRGYQVTHHPIEYEKLKSDPAWLKKNQGKYVAFIEGKLIKITENDTPQSGKDLLEWLTQEKNLHNKERFFAQVPTNSSSTVIDEPMSLAFDGFQY